MSASENNQKNNARKNSGKNKKKSEDSGLSMGTILLILLTVAVAVLCIFLIVKAAENRKSPSPSKDPGLSLKEPSSGTLSGWASSLLSATDPPPSSNASPSRAPSFFSHPSPTPPPVTPTPTPIPSPDPMDKTSKVYMNVPSMDDQKALTVEKEGKTCTVSYFIPQLTVPDNRSLQDVINADLAAGTAKTVERLRGYLSNNFDPFMMEPINESIEIHFYKSRNTLSVVLIYPVIAGNGDTVSMVTSMNYDAQSGARLSVGDLILNKTAIVNWVKRNLECGEDPDFGILETSALCDGWYIEGSTLSLLFNGRRIDTLNPGILRSDVSGDGLFEY